MNFGGTTFPVIPMRPVDHLCKFQRNVDQQRHPILFRDVSDTFAKVVRMQNVVDPDIKQFKKLYFKLFKCHLVFCLDVEMRMGVLENVTPKPIADGNLLQEGLLFLETPPLK